MQGIDFWRLADELSVVQAALLITGVDPSGKEYDIERRASKPEGYDAIKHSLVTSVKNGSLKGKEITEIDAQYDTEYVDMNKTLIEVSALKVWLRKKGVQRHFFFFPEEPEGEFLSRDNPRYSPKLAAAVRAWQALEDEALHEKTPKQSVIVWLRKHSAKYDLQDKDGKLKEGTIEEIAKIVNWNPRGGAPSTPFGAGSDQAVTGYAADNIDGEMFSVLEEKKEKNRPIQNFDFDTDAPF